MTRSCFAARVFIALLWPVGPASATAVDEWPFGEGAYERYVQRVEKAQGAEYRSVLTIYDAYLHDHPQDAIAAVERCRFIDRFAYAEDFTIEAASEDSERCHQQLAAGPLADTPPAQLFALENDWGPDSIAHAEQLSRQSESWPAQQQAALHSALYNRYLGTDKLKAGTHALKAVRMNPASELKPAAAEYLIQIGAPAQAGLLIRQTPPEAYTAWTLRRSVSLLLDLEEPKAALDIASGRGDLTLDGGLKIRLARALSEHGYREDGARLMDEILLEPEAGTGWNPALYRELLLLQIGHDDRTGAIAAYEALRKAGYRGDPWGYYRLRLTAHYPDSPWAWSDGAGLLALLMLILVFCVLPVAVVMPLHYWILFRMSRGRIPDKTAAWGLGHLWYALAVFLLSSLLPLYALCYGQFEQMFQTLDGVMLRAASVSERNLANAFVLSNVLAFVGLLPLLRGTRFRSLWLGNWSVTRSILTGVGATFVMLSVAGIASRTASLIGTPGVVLGSETIRAMQGMYAHYGLGFMLLFSALLTPAIEELVFRGVFLRVASQHMRCWIAAALQACVFTLAHDQPGSYSYLLLLAMVAAWLSRKSGGGLLAPLTLHATNNLLVSLHVVGLTRSLGSM